MWFSVVYDTCYITTDKKNQKTTKIQTYIFCALTFSRVWWLFHCATRCISVHDLTHLGWAAKGRGLKVTSKRPEGDLVPSQGHNQHCSTINPSLLYYFQIIFKWVKSLWRIKTLLNPPISLHFNGGHAILSGWGRQRLRATLRRWSATATGQCENGDTGEGQQTSAQIS